MNDSQEYVANMEKQCAEMSFLIGMIHVGLIELENHVDLPVHLKERISTLLNTVNDKVIDLFYKDISSENQKDGVTK